MDRGNGRCVVWLIAVSLLKESTPGFGPPLNVRIPIHFQRMEKSHYGQIENSDSR